MIIYYFAGISSPPLVFFIAFEDRSINNLTMGFLEYQRNPIDEMYQVSTKLLRWKYT